MPTPALPLLTKWPCANTCITAYDGFCERFTFTNIWPATAQCLLGSCSDKDRIALQKSVGEYCDAVGYPDVWGPYMWGATDDGDTSVQSSTTVKSISKETTASAQPSPTSPTTFLNPPPPATVTVVNNAAATTSTESNTPSPTYSSEALSSKSSGLPVGAKAGIAVGVVLAAALVLLMWWFLRWRKKKNEPNFPEGPDHSPTPSPHAKAFEEAPVISYSIEGGMLTRKDKPNLSIRVI
ncbi:hypothetical protein TWF730_006212 [Orbilia blumenaviensis]|uniref:Extracellular membrane protein CFEM domain-containing protein n=1 Tax=Orbilia blumenaviensis TaxID=1796055 RepID=A0AAV9VET0_9PEZI